MSEVSKKSLKNLRPNKPKVGAKSTHLKLPIAIRDVMRLIGEGDMTRGVETVFAQLPLLRQIQIYLQQQAAGGDEQAELLLIEMEKLNIESAYKEAIADGAIELPGGSWLVE